MLSPFLSLLLILLVLALCFYLFNRFIVPTIPAPWGKIIMAVFAIIVIIFLLNKYVGLGL